MDVLWWMPQPDFRVEARGCIPQAHASRPRSRARPSAGRFAPRSRSWSHRKTWQTSKNGLKDLWTT